MFEQEPGGQAAGSRKRGTGSLDAAIDGAVREMLDVEPPPGLRGRVLDRIHPHGPVASALSPHSPVASAFRRKRAWIFVPVAAAALIVLAVTAPWRDGAAPATAPTPPPVIAQRATPPVVPPVAPPVVAPITRPTRPHAGTVATNDPARRAAITLPPDRLVEAAVAAVEDANFTAIDALAGPKSIAIERLRDPLPSSMGSIEPAPLQIRALEITALPEAPRERREE